MFRLTHGATPLLVGLLALTGCPGDDTSIVDTDGDTDDTGTTGDTTNPTDPTATSSSTDPTIDPDSGSSTGDPEPPMCEPACGAGECCVGAPGEPGICFDEPEPTCNGCADTEICQFPEGADPCDPGTMAECVTCGIEADSYDGCFLNGGTCPDGEECLSGPENNFGVCSPTDECSDACDCPLPPGTGDAVNICIDILGNSRCVLDCSGGETCPDGLACRNLAGNQICAEVDPDATDCCISNGSPGCDNMMCQDTVCAADPFCCSQEWDQICADGADTLCQDPNDPMFSICGSPWEEPPPPEPLYGDCINGGMCDGAMGHTCVSDGTIGWCSIAGCMDDMDCLPVPPTGDAPNACVPLLDDGMGGVTNACILDCAMGQTCPDGMSCFMDSFCVWAPPPPAGFGNCGLTDAVCNMGEVCLNDGDPMMMIDPTWAFCTDDTCADASECGFGVDSGDAPVTCADPTGMGGPNTCYLDCAGGQTCPDGMTCTNGSWCAWPQGMEIFSDDFETGDFSMGWTLNDVDMQMPDPNVAFVTDAWVVSDQVQGPNFSAVSTSWYMPVGQSDDWLISPQIMLGANSRVSWTAISIDPNFPDGYELYISTAGTAIADFMANPVLFSTSPEAETLQARFADLGAAGYMNQPVHLAWRNNTNDGFLLLVDNVVVADLP